MPKNRGAEQGDVDGPSDCSARLGMVALEARLRVAEQQALEPSPGSAHKTQQTQEEFKMNNATGCSKSKTFSSAAQKNSSALTIRDMLCKKNGGLADQWYLDDGDIICHPLLVLPYLQAFDTANAEIGAERNPQKTEVIHYVKDLDAAHLEWRVNDVRPSAFVSTTAHGNVTLGVAVGPRQFVADQLLVKTDAIRAMHECVQLCARFHKQNLPFFARVLAS